METYSAASRSVLEDLEAASSDCLAWVSSRRVSWRAVPCSLSSDCTSSSCCSVSHLIVLVNIGIRMMVVLSKKMPHNTK